MQKEKSNFIVGIGSAAALAVTLLVVAGWSGKLQHDPQSEIDSHLSKAVFENDGSLRLPVGYRQWEHVGTRIKPDGRSVLDGSQITVPQVMDAYAEPSAFDSFNKNGTWPDGTQIIKEISLIKTGKDCDKTTLSALLPSGQASSRRAT